MGRQVEFEKLKGRQVYEVVPRSDATMRVKALPEAKFVKTRWVDTGG